MLQQRLHPTRLPAGTAETGSRRGGRGMRPKGRGGAATAAGSAGTAAHGANDVEGVVAGLHVSDALNAAKHAVAELWVPQRKPNPGANGAKVTLLRRPQGDTPATPSAGNTLPPTTEPSDQPAGAGVSGTKAAHDTGHAPAAAAPSASRRRRHRPPARRSAARVVEDIAAVEPEPDSVDDTPATVTGRSCIQCNRPCKRQAGHSTCSTWH